MFYYRGLNPSMVIHCSLKCQNVDETNIACPLHINSKRCRNQISGGERDNQALQKTKCILGYMNASYGCLRTVNTC